MQVVSIINVRSFLNYTHHITSSTVYMYCEFEMLFLNSQPANNAHLLHINRVDFFSTTQS